MLNQCILFPGVFVIPFDALKEPPEYLKVREVKEWYVDYLLNMLLKEECDHEDLTAPLLVIASVDKKAFQEHSIKNYTFEV